MLVASYNFKIIPERRIARRAKWMSENLLRNLSKSKTQTMGITVLVLRN